MKIEFDYHVTGKLKHVNINLDGEIEKIIMAFRSMLTEASK